MAAGTEIRVRAVADLKPYDRNARTHSAAQIDQLARSIQEFGFTNPVLVTEDGLIVAGHGRVEAARKLGIKAVPTLALSGLTPEQVRAYTLADNRLALDAGWDFDLLRAEMLDLRDLGFDTSVLGFDDLELEKLFAPDGAGGLTDDDAIPEAADRVVSLTGDLWILGPHRLLCGDSTSATDVARLLGDVRPGLMVTDPPYGVEYDPSRRRRAQSAGSKPAQGQVANDDRADWREAWSLFAGDVAYVWHGMKAAAVVEESLAAAGFEVRSQIVWAKSKAVVSPKNINPKTMGYAPAHECCFYAIRKGGRSGWHGGRQQTTLWQIEHQASETGHGTQKPVQAMLRPIENNSSPGQAVYEPFSGSGTTIIAAQRSGRSCLAMELKPEYVDLAVRRWQDYSGQTATLADDGRTFDEIAASRA